MDKPLVKLSWLDAHGSAVGTYSLEEIPHAPIEVVSYGILLREDEVGVSIASECCDGDTYRGYTFVPKSLVLKVEPVKRVRKKKAPLVGEPIISTLPPDAKSK